MHYRIAILSKFHNYISLFAMGVAEGAVLNYGLPVSVEVDGSKGRNDYKYYIHELINIFTKIRPHIIFCNGLLGETEVIYPGILDFLHRLRRKGIKVCYHMGDPRTEPRYPNDVSRAFDVILMNIGDKEVLANFSSIWKVPTYYWPYGCLRRKYIIDPEKPFSRLDMVYTGNMSTHERYIDRTEFVKRCSLSGVFRLTIIPSSVYNNTRYYHHTIASSCRAMLGVCARYDIDLYIDARPFECLGGGGLLFRPVSKGIEKVFVDKEHLILFGSTADPYDIKDLEDKYRYYVLDNPSEGTKIKKKGFEFVQKYHTYENRVRDIIELLEGKIDRPRVLLEDFGL